MNRCPIPHEEIKLHEPTFMMCTERLPHHQDSECIQLGALWRNCISCKSTLVRRLAADGE